MAGRWLCCSCRAGVGDLRIEGSRREVRRRAAREGAARSGRGRSEGSQRRTLDQRRRDRRQVQRVPFTPAMAPPTAPLSGSPRPAVRQARLPAAVPAIEVLQACFAPLPAARLRPAVAALCRRRLGGTRRARGGGDGQGQRQAQALRLFGGRRARHRRRGHRRRQRPLARLWQRRWRCTSADATGGWRWCR